MGEKSVLRNFVGGKAVEPADGRYADLVDPATKQPSPPLASRMLEATKERGLLIGKGGLVGNTLRMAPPLTLTEAEAKEGLSILTDALTAVNEEASAQ